MISYKVEYQDLENDGNFSIELLLIDIPDYLIPQNEEQSSTIIDTTSLVDKSSDLN